jgi:hypothetical protein
VSRDGLSQAGEVMKRTYLALHRNCDVLPDGFVGDGTTSSTREALLVAALRSLGVTVAFTEEFPTEAVFDCPADGFVDVNMIVDDEPIEPTVPPHLRWVTAAARHHERQKVGQ